MFASDINTDEQLKMHQGKNKFKCWSQKFNVKGLGLKQLQLINRMVKEKLVVVVVFDWYDNSTTIELQDESGDNTYESVSKEMMKSLGNRRLLDCLGWKPSLRITVDTYSLKKRTIEALGLSSITESTSERGNRR